MCPPHLNNVAFDASVGPTCRRGRPKIGGLLTHSTGKSELGCRQTVSDCAHSQRVGFSSYG